MIHAVVSHLGAMWGVALGAKQQGVRGDQSTFIFWCEYCPDPTPTLTTLVDTCIFLRVLHIVPIDAMQPYPLRSRVCMPPCALNNSVLVCVYLPSCYVRVRLF